MIGKIIQPELEAFIASRDFSGLQAVFKEMLVPDIAEVIEDIKPTDRAVLFRLLPKQIAMETFEYLDGTAQRELLAELGKAEVVSLLDEMHPDDRTALLEDLPGTITPFVATLVDVTGLVIYFSVASVVLSGTLL